MLAPTSYGCSSSSFLSLSTLNRRPLPSHHHAFLAPPTLTVLLIQKSAFYALHRCQYFLNIDNGGSGEDEEQNDLAKAKTSGTSARGRRLLRVREEKRKREYDRIHKYPTWAKILENACKDDEELRAVLGDSVGNPELMRKRVEERVRKKGKDFRKSKTGSVLAFKVSFREFGRLTLSPINGHFRSCSHNWLHLSLATVALCPPYVDCCFSGDCCCHPSLVTGHLQSSFTALAIGYL